MNSLEPLIADLALILICAGVMTLLFKRLKQPVVLGYIVAGFLASPNMTYMPSVTDPSLRKQSEKMSKTFSENLTERENEE